MKLTLNLAAVTAAMLTASLTSPCVADELGDKGREIFKKNQRAVVTVQVVMKTKVSMPGQGSDSREAKQDITGTVVDGSGLTVLALSACDPSAMYESMMAGMADEDMQFKMETELTDVKILWFCFFLSKEKYNLTEGFITSFDYSILQVFL